ncbi:MAG: hypothetical protein HC859_13575 [Bacteroidia bacterium]|nr:hypothetical protein [Bacteroidia bacterium]
MKKYTTLSILFIFTFACTLTIFFSGCESDDPTKENTPELITRVTLTFTPDGGGTVVTATASDPDGEGVQDIAADGPVTLAASTSYTLTVALVNELADPLDPEYDITAEVEEESDEHMFFFSFTEDAFSSPAGNGNTDNRNDPLNYNDEDANGLPLGLETTWTTGNALPSGSLRIILKHQPDQKSATSDVAVGETDLDVTFDLVIE